MSYGKLDDGETSTVTGADGGYSFTGLAPGVYAVREGLQTGWAQTFALPFVSLGPGEKDVDVNFGNRALPGSISGYKWNDLDGDGVKGEAEPGLSDWVIYLDENESGTYDDGERSTGTYSDGFYSFSQVPVGNHTVAEFQKPGWAATYTPPAVVIGPGQAVENVNFGNRLVHPLGDYNRDTVVDAADYVVLRKFLGTIDLPPYSGADGDGSSMVDAADEAVWSSQFGTAAPPIENSIAGNAPTAVQAFAVIGENPAPEDRSSASAKPHVKESSNGFALRPDVYPRSIDVFRFRGENSRSAQAREASRAKGETLDRLEVALRTWLPQAFDHVETVDNAVENNGCDPDSARDAYFESLETTFASVGTDASRSALTRRGARLIALQ